MRRIVYIAFGILLFLFPVNSPIAIGQGGPITVPGDDEEMNVAIEKARRRLPWFMAQLAKPGAGESGFAVKVQLPVINHETDVNGEHIWVINIEIDPEGNLSGDIDNDPQHLSGLKAGDRLVFTIDEITDWMFLRNGKIVGNETRRALLKFMSPEERASAFQMFADP